MTVATSDDPGATLTGRTSAANNRWLQSLLARAGRRQDWTARAFLELTMERPERPRPIRVMVVDDSAVVRSGLAAFLLASDDFELVAEAADGEEAVARCLASRPDVVLMDLVMPGVDGATATRAIRENCPAAKDMALTSFREGVLVDSALAAGAVGYLLKNLTAEELAAALRTACAGRPAFSPEVSRPLEEAGDR